jgi:glycerol uptake facilitator-like aquaporin
MAIAMGWQKPDNVAGSSAPAIMVGLFVASGGLLFGYDTGCTVSTRRVPSPRHVRFHVVPSLCHRLGWRHLVDLASPSKKFVGGNTDGK